MAADDSRQAPLPVDMTPTLVARLRDGDAKAGELLDRLYREKLIAFCHGYLGRRDAAEDVVQGAFCRVLESRTVPENFRAWIYKICRNGASTSGVPGHATGTKEPSPPHPISTPG